MTWSHGPFTGPQRSDLTMRVRARPGPIVCECNAPTCQVTPALAGKAHTARERSVPVTE